MAISTLVVYGTVVYVDTSERKLMQFESAKVHHVCSAE